MNARTAKLLQRADATMGGTTSQATKRQWNRMPWNLRSRLRSEIEKQIKGDG